MSSIGYASSMPQDVDRAFRPKSRAIPGFTFRIALAAEQDRLAMLAAGHQHQHRIGLGETGQVPEIGILPIRIIAYPGCGCARARRAGPGSRRRPPPASIAACGATAPGVRRPSLPSQCRRWRWRGPSVQSRMQQQHRHPQVFLDLRQRLLVAFRIHVIDPCARKVGDVAQALLRLPPRASCRRRPGRSRPGTHGTSRTWHRRVP